MSSRSQSWCASRPIDGQLSAAHLAALLADLAIKPIEVVSVRPAGQLPGNPFTGLFDPALRESYIVAGREAALSVLPSLIG